MKGKGRSKWLLLGLLFSRITGVISIALGIFVVVWALTVSVSEPAPTVLWLSALVLIVAGVSLAAGD